MYGQPFDHISLPKGEYLRAAAPAHSHFRPYEAQRRTHGKGWKIKQTARRKTTVAELPKYDSAWHAGQQNAGQPEGGWSVSVDLWRGVF